MPDFELLISPIDPLAFGGSGGGGRPFKLSTDSNSASCGSELIPEHLSEIAGSR